MYITGANLLIIVIFFSEHSVKSYKTLKNSPERTLCIKLNLSLDNSFQCLQGNEYLCLLIKRIKTYITLIHANNTPTNRSIITLHPNEVKRKATYSLKVDHMSSA